MGRWWGKTLLHRFRLDPAAPPPRWIASLASAAVSVPWPECSRGYEHPAVPEPSTPSPHRHGVMAHAVEIESRAAAEFDAVHVPCGATPLHTAACRAGAPGQAGAPRGARRHWRSFVFYLLCIFIGAQAQRKRKQASIAHSLANEGAGWTRGSIEAAEGRGAERGSLARTRRRGGGRVVGCAAWAR
jgi:hypothetical protein